MRAAPRPRTRPWRIAALGLVAAAGCTALGPVPLDVPPGHRVVLGRVDLSALQAAQGVLEIVKEDGTFGYALVTGPGRDEFAITLPPGRYRVVGLSLVRDQQSFPEDPVWRIRLTFEVGPEPAVYVGTLRVASGFGQQVRVTVTDELEDTIRVLRAWYRDLPDTTARSLLVPE